jgi:hypothetical protein
MRFVRVTFHVGLGLAAAVFALAALSIIETRLRGALQTEALLGYVALGLSHVLLLGFFGSKLSPALRPAVAGWLYTAGFLHTLIGLGIAVAMAGSSLMDGGQLAGGALGAVLAPMGAALLPHAVGVWIGQSLEGQRADAAATIQESVLKKLADDGEHSRGVLRELYKQREDLLRAEVSALERQITLWDSVHASLAKSLNDAVAQVNTISDATRKVASAVQEPAKQLGAVLAELGKEVAAASASAHQLRENLSASANEAGRLQPGIRETIAVMGDLKRLQASVVELLQSEIFKRE